MNALLDSMRTGFTGFVKDGQFLMLFMVALLLLWLVDDSNKKAFRKFCLTILLLLIFPLTAKILLIYQTPFYGSKDLWELLPVTALLSYGLVMAFYMLFTALTKEYGRWKSAPSKMKEQICQAAAVLILTGVLFLCGTLDFSSHVQPVSSTAMVPETALKVYEQMDLQEEQVTILAPQEITTWARIYSNHIILLYGRNMFEPELCAYTYDSYGEDLIQLKDWVIGTLPAPRELDDAVMQEEMYLSLCESQGISYLVFTQGRDKNELLQCAMGKQKAYKKAGETEDYVIYQLEK